MRTHGMFFGMFGLLLGFPLVSCHTFPGEGPPEGSHGVNAVQFEDIPVPQGMVLKDSQHRSHSIQTGDYRYGEFVYEGSLSLAQVSQYLTERMPQYNWSQVDKQFPAPDVMFLQFQRGHSVADCSLTRDQAMTVMRITVQTRPGAKKN